MRITSQLTGGMRFVSEVRGHEVIVDNPIESGGTDAGPTPPELVAIALGTCVGIYAVNFCRKHDLSTEGMTVHTDWEKAQNPARIGMMSVRIIVPAGIPEDKYEAFMATIRKCLVHNTLCQMPEMSIALVTE